MSKFSAVRAIALTGLSLPVGVVCALPPDLVRRFAGRVADRGKGWFEVTAPVVVKHGVDLVVAETEALGKANAGRVEELKDPPSWAANLTTPPSSFAAERAAAKAAARAAKSAEAEEAPKSGGKGKGKGKALAEDPAAGSDEPPAPPA